MRSRGHQSAGQPVASGAGNTARVPPRPPPYASLMEAEALEEAEAAIEAIVRPLRQPVELLPRAPEVSKIDKTIPDLRW